MASPGAETKYSLRSPKLTMICPGAKAGAKRTVSRPLSPTTLPPPQSQNSCADAGAACRQANSIEATRMRAGLDPMGVIDVTSVKWPA